MRDLRTYCNNVCVNVSIQCRNSPVRRGVVRGLDLSEFETEQVSDDLLFLDFWIFGG